MSFFFLHSRRFFTLGEQEKVLSGSQTHQIYRKSEAIAGGERAQTKCIKTNTIQTYMSSFFSYITFASFSIQTFVSSLFFSLKIAQFLPRAHSIVFKGARKLPTLSTRCQRVQNILINSNVLIEYYQYHILLSIQQGRGASFSNLYLIKSNRPLVLKLTCYTTANHMACNKQLVASV